MPEENQSSNSSTSLIWDISTRIFHWALVSLVLFQWLSAEILDNAIDWHLLGGYTLLGLITFRIIWGFVGPEYVRFSNFIYTPKTILDYARHFFDRNSDVYTGHNPMGGLVVLVMLLLLLGQAVSGLFIDDDIVTSGPYYGTIPTNLQTVMETLHHWCFDLLMYVVTAHIIVVLYYQFYKKQTLIAAMIHGRKMLVDKGITSQKIILALVIASIVALGIYVIVEVLAPQQDYSDYF